MNILRSRFSKGFISTTAIFIVASLIVGGALSFFLFSDVGREKAGNIWQTSKNLLIESPSVQERPETASVFEERRTSPQSSPSKGTGRRKSKPEPIFEEKLGAALSGNPAPTSRPNQTLISSPQGLASPRPTFLPTPSASPKSSPSPSPTPIAQILLSEIQVAGQTASDEFVELFNPNDFPVDLSGWAIRRKSRTGTEYSLVAAERLRSKIIPARGYFLVGNEGGYSGGASADVLWAQSNTLAQDNTVVLYATANGVVIDRVGFGEAQDYEGQASANPAVGQSLSRQNSNDTNNNRNDFILSSPTPRNSQSGSGFSAPISAPTSSPSPSPSPSPQSSPSPSPVSSPLPSPTPSPSPSPSPLASPSPSPSPSPTPPPKILINEIQIASSTANDEFIELYNPNDFAVDLSGWTLKKKTSGGSESNLVSKSAFTGIIPARGFFLIAHPSDYTGSVTPDLRYSGITYYIAASSTVLLYDSAGILIDKVGFGGATDFETSPALNPDVGKSIQRINFQDTDNNSQDFELNSSPTPKNTGG